MKHISLFILLCSFAHLHGSQQLSATPDEIKLALFCLGCIQRQIKMTDIEIDAMPKWHFDLGSFDAKNYKQRWRQEDHYYIQFTEQFRLQTALNPHGTPIFRPYNKTTVPQLSDFINRLRKELEQGSPHYNI